MSFSNKSANGCMREILHMIHVNKYSIDMSIELEDKKLYNINI